MEQMNGVESRVGNYDGLQIIKTFLDKSENWDTEDGKAIRAELGKRIREVEQGDENIRDTTLEG